MTSIAKQIEFSENLQKQIETLQQQLDAANQRIDEHKRAFLELVKTNGEKHRKLEAAERKLAEIASYASGECLVPTPPESQDWESREEWTIEWIRRVATGEQARGQIEPDVNGLEALARRHHRPKQRLPGEVRPSMSARAWRVRQRGHDLLPLSIQRPR